ncbi:unnamed protein product, partial [Prorocentrum cordatum]
MDVDRDNFEEALVAIEEHLPAAAFVAVDYEFTGIRGPWETSVARGDVPQVQYAKMRKVVNQPFNVVQAGICLFEETAPGAFQCRPFNVFVFPRAVDERTDDGKVIQDDPFLGLSASTVAFLAENGLDFQRWLTKGVSYTSASAEAELLKAMPPEEGAVCEAAVKSGFRAGKERLEPKRPGDSPHGARRGPRTVGEFVASGAEDMKLPSMNNFMALVIRQRINEVYPKLTVEKRGSASNFHQERWVMNLSPEGKVKRNQDKRRELLALIGFRRLWRLLKTSKKPLIVHNGFFDLLFSFAAFDRPLPPTLEAFKAQVHLAFPAVFDTKVLGETPELSGRLGPRTVLAGMGEALGRRMRPLSAAGAIRPLPRSAGTGEAPDAEDVSLITIGESGEEVVHLSFSLPEGFDRYSKSVEFHTAGYDAFVTGQIFAYFRAVLGGERIEDFSNRVYLMFSAFQLELSRQSDRLMFDGVVRYLCHVSASIGGSRGLEQLLRPLTQEGDRRAEFRWIGQDSLLLVLHGGDAAAGAPGRE